jgi:hypothetical protein
VSPRAAADVSAALGAPAMREQPCCSTGPTESRFPITPFRGRNRQRDLSVTGDSRGTEISDNQIGRTSADRPDSFGIEVSVDNGSSATAHLASQRRWRPAYRRYPKL